MCLDPMLLNHQDELLFGAPHFKSAATFDSQLGCPGVLSHPVLLLSDDSRCVMTLPDS